ncbi:NrfD/PsrC family molybdoenzyme membrane anchor subunit [Consotaella salsifontis]|uniref:Tetrathionate reductase subunit C n=1 Tax=Consotaella salsifontis TaxID=1365950 RepID=A0A1T4PL86_9HYPH|nr:NrfD/PsrC family molybdoenzyme membrane anchor subunit [Consotaella salsifontis]SJZ92111.1 tetrathionate reductase subunit C [Consotaella salsifontis]
MDEHILELINVTREVAWLPWAVQYFFLIGISVGAVLLSLPGYWIGRPNWTKLSRLALVVALVCGLAAPVALVSDLHQPNRFWHFYVAWRPHSWMWWGSFFIPVYIGGLLFYAWAALRPEIAAQGRVDSRLGRLYRLVAMGEPRGAGLMKLAGAVVLVGAGLVALYTGVEVYVVRAQILWHTPLLPFQFLLTGLAGALGLVLVLNPIVGDGDARVEVKANRLLALVLAGVMVLGMVWLGLGYFDLDAANAQALRTVAASPAWRNTAIWAALATLVPFLIALVKPRGTGILTGLIAIHSAWMFRWTVFIDGQSIPKTGAGFYEYALPRGAEGLLGIVGTAGLCLFLLVVITALLPMPKRPATGAAETAFLHPAE